MCDWEKGIVKVSSYLCVYPGYTFDDFKKTVYYKNQDGIRQIILDGFFLIDCHRFKVSLIFIKNKLYSLSLLCCDIDIQRVEEKKRKLLHDSILAEKGIIDTDFIWGKLVSQYDSRGDVCHITFYYL